MSIRATDPARQAPAAAPGPGETRRPWLEDRLGAAARTVNPVKPDVRPSAAATLAEESEKGRIVRIVV